MDRKRKILLTFATFFLPAVFLVVTNAFGSSAETVVAEFPRALDTYGDAGTGGLLGTLANRIHTEPFNLVATLIFFAAIIHTFLSSRFLAIAHKWEAAHETAKAKGEVPRNSTSHGAELFHFFGEVEAIFGIWCIALIVSMVAYFDWHTASEYLIHGVDFTEAMFVVVIMTLAASRPILKLSESLMWKVSSLLGGTLGAWWFTILTVGPLIGSLITEPAAMTISALLLADKFYELEPTPRFKYATIGLLFVNISVGGTLTNFAAPPVLMVAESWGWGTPFMLTNFGWKTVIGILISNSIYFLVFRGEFSRLEESFELRRLRDEIRTKYLGRDAMEDEWDAIVAGVDEEVKFTTRILERIEAGAAKIKKRLQEEFLDSIVARGIDKDLAQKAFDQRFEEVKLLRFRRGMPIVLPPEQRAPFLDPEWDSREDSVPVWITLIHVMFLGWTVFNAHHPALFVPGLLFFLGFSRVTYPYQNRVDLKPPLLVGFFLGGLVVHGGLQAWWIEPVLGGLAEFPLMLAATVLTAFNDNAAITFLSTLVPDFTDNLKYAVVAGAVTGGGLTVIANAPNPAGQALLKKYFSNGVSPSGLLVAALVPTSVFFLLFNLLP
jgi:hypothetical protein